MRVYKNKKNVVLIPLYNKGMIVEMNPAEYRKLKKDVPAVAERKIYKGLDATLRQAFWLAGLKVVYTPEGAYRLF